MPHAGGSSTGGGATKGTPGKGDAFVVKPGMTSGEIGGLMDVDKKAEQPPPTVKAPKDSPK